MKKETVPNSPVCIWSFTSLIVLIALIVLKKLRLLITLRLHRLLLLLRLLIFAAFRISMWTWAKENWFFTHRLCSGIVDDEPQGYTVFTDLISIERAAICTAHPATLPMMGPHTFKRWPQTVQQCPQPCCNHWSSPEEHTVLTFRLGWLRSLNLLGRAVLSIISCCPKKTPERAIHGPPRSFDYCNYFN